MRGRKPLPNALHELRGNPGKRKRVSDSGPAVPPLEPPPASALPRAEQRQQAELSLEAATKPASADPSPSASIDVPEFLTGARERRIFLLMVEELMQRRIARSTDLISYARWASWLERWIVCKEALDGKLGVYKSESPHGTYWRRHPLASEMSIIEGRLISLEDRLGLNPAARQNIIRGVMAAPGDLFPAKEGDSPKPPEDSDDASDSPLGWMETAPAGRPN